MGTRSKKPGDTKTSRFLPTTAAGFAIRAPQAGDEADIFHLLEGETSPLDYNDPRHPLNEAARLVEAGDGSGRKSRGWLAVVDEKGVGLITTHEGFNGGIFVDENYRRRGIAEALVTAREDFMRTQGVNEIRAHIEPTNPKSIALHEKLGYALDPVSSNDKTLVFVKSLTAQSLGSDKKTAPRVTPARTPK